MPDNDNLLLPVTLPTWPSCNDCLAWCDDDLAVAAGEVIYILTRKGDSSKFEAVGHAQWHISTVCTNQFRQEEWADQTIATIADFSIGEEQSNSLVVALSWSEAGLGKHRRAVLTILTSNLVLSFWETDGVRANFRRTCVVNNFLVRQVPGSDASRRALRVRSFAWLPPVKTALDPRWGFHHLIVADDTGTVSFLHVFKTESGTEGKWHIKVALVLDVRELDATASDFRIMSPLQKRIHKQSPVTGIHASSWAKVPLRPGQSSVQRADKSVSEISIRKGSTNFIVSVCASVSGDGRKVSLSRYQETGHNGNQTNGWEANALTPTALQLNLGQKSFPMDALYNTYFSEAIEPLRNGFSESFQLSDHVRTRFWGSTTSTDGTQAVCCFTLHPSDMIEYTTPSSERCTLVFRATGEESNTTTINTAEDPTIVQEKILQFADGFLENGEMIYSVFDAKVQKAYVNLASTILPPQSELSRSLERLNERLRVLSDDDTVNQGVTPAGELRGLRHLSDIDEECEVCEARIPFTTDAVRGRCVNGHQFSRCQLSFLTIQEPGISKYCSKCGKQFLDLTKLGSTQGLSFARTVFDRFDVCPYCQAKYRG